MISILRLLLCSLILFSLYTVQAQTHEWSYNLGSTINDEGRKVDTDDDGNVYITGFFTGTVDFDPGVGITNRTSEGGQDGYVVKLNKDGVFQYVYTFGGTSNDLPIDIAVADDGRVYLVGVFRGTADFFPSSLFGILRTSNGEEDLFLLQLNNTGLFQWVVPVGGSENDGAHDVAIDSNGDVIITGGFEGLVIDFNPLGPASSRTALGDENIFVAKYQDTGQLIWVRSFGNAANDDLATGLAVDSNDDIYICGHFVGDIDFTPGTAGGNVTNPTGRDGFLMKYNAAGTEQWYRHFDGAFEVVPRAVTVSYMDEVYVTGYFQGLGVDFDGQAVSSAGSADIFLSKYDANGNQEWIDRFGGTGLDTGEDVATAPCGNVFICGSIEGTVDFDSGPGVANVFAPSSSGFFTQYGYFVASLSESATLRWADGGGNASGNARANGITLDDCEDVILTGSMNVATPLNFNSNATNTPVGSGDFFVSKHNLPNITVTTILPGDKGSLRNAIACANERLGRDSILFCLKGAAATVHTFMTPATFSIVVDDSTIIYAPSQPDYFPGKIQLEDQIFLSGSDHSEINGIRMTNNAGNAGIFAFNSTHLLIQDNIIGGCSNGLQISSCEHLRVQGNIIGLAPDGVSPDGNSASGISINSDSCQIGGLLANQGNTIASNNWGISIRGNHHIIQGNLIGTDLSGTLNRANIVSGIDLFPNADSSLIGGPLAGAGNVIANSFYGIVSNDNVGNTFSQNSIYCNSVEGINLVLPNVGFPVIVTPDMSGISGTANPGDVIELFEHNTTGCATAPCQGKTFLGSATTDAAGIWYVGGPFPIGMSITATATDAQGNTSEFSLCNVVDALLDGQQTVEEELTKQTAPRQISLSPNPTQGICQLSWPYEGSVRLRLLNPKGQTILTEQVETEIYYKQLDLSHLAKGIYTVEVMSSFGERQSLRLIRQ